MTVQLTQLRPFIPSGKDFETSKTFFQKLGFAINWEAEGLIELQWGDVVFLLQDFEHQDMQENLMMYLTVSDLDAFWSHLVGTGILDEFSGVKAKEPTDYPWGSREVHLIDPAGVCWHIAE